MRAWAEGPTSIEISPRATAAISESDNGWPVSCIIRILLEMTGRNNKRGCGNGCFAPPSPKKSQADKPTWPFWLKLSAGGQLESYFEYVDVVVAAVSFF